MQSRSTSQAVERTAAQTGHMNPSTVPSLTQPAPTSTTGLSFAQQLYASSVKKPASASPGPPPAPSASTNASARTLVPQRSNSINLAAPAPPPIVAPVENRYPPQLMNYLARHNPGSATSYGQTSTPSPGPDTPPASAFPQPPVLSQNEQTQAAMIYNNVEQRPLPTGPQGGSQVASTSYQAPTPMRPSEPILPPVQPLKTAAHRAVQRKPTPEYSYDSGSAASPVHARSATFSGGTAATSSSASSPSMPSPPPHIQTIASPPVNIHQRSATQPAADIRLTPELVAQPSSAQPTRAMQTSMPTAQHYASTSASAAYSTSPTSSSSVPPPPPLQGPSGSQSTAYSVTQTPVDIVQSPGAIYPSASMAVVASTSSQSQNQNQPLSQSPSYPFPNTGTTNQGSPSTTNYVASPRSPPTSFPPTPGLIPSSASQPPTPISPVPATPPSIFTRPLNPGAQPQNQNVQKKRGLSLGANRNKLFGLATGAAAGLLGGAMLNNVLNNDGGDNVLGGLDVNNLIDGVGNLMNSNSNDGGVGDSGGGDGGGGLLDGMFNGVGGNGGDSGGGSGAGGGDYSPAMDTYDGGNPYMDPSLQVDPSLQANPYFDQQTQSPGGNPYYDSSIVGTDQNPYFDPSNQANPYDQQQLYQQQQQQQQQSGGGGGPDYMHMAHDAYNKVHQFQQHHQQQQHTQAQAHVQHHAKSGSTGGPVHPSQVSSSHGGQLSGTAAYQQYQQHQPHAQQHSNSGLTGGPMHTSPVSSPHGGQFSGTTANAGVHHQSTLGTPHVPPSLSHQNTFSGYEAAHNAHFSGAGTQAPSHAQMFPAGYHAPQHSQTYPLPYAHTAQQGGMHTLGSPKPPPTTPMQPIGQHYQQQPGQAGLAGPSPYQQNQTYQYSTGAVPGGPKPGIKITSTHVKQFAKGALMAGSFLARLNGVTIPGTNNNS